MKHLIKITLICICLSACTTLGEFSNILSSKIFFDWESLFNIFKTDTHQYFHTHHDGHGDENRNKNNTIRLYNHYNKNPNNSANLLSFQTSDQIKKHKSSLEIYEAIQKLNFLGTVLYIAAHPDDENTKIISYLSNKINARTAYLSLTRGGGGQNLIGKEIGDLLGVLRSEELLSARQVDGGYQFFSTAIDFGYSKYPEETFRLWDKKQVLSDIVRVIRKFRPDIIINRFDHRKSGSTHGHHTASAILSVLAYDKSSDKDYMKDIDTYSPTRLFYNISPWEYGGKENFDQLDKSGLTALNIGGYYPLLGRSNIEISNESRSFHKCQGFGMLKTRGVKKEYLELIKGKKSPIKDNLFGGIDTNWTRIDGGNAIGNILLNIEKKFNFKTPSSHVPELIKAYKLIQKIRDPYWRILKSKQVKAIIKSCLGLSLSVSSDERSSSPGVIASISLGATNHSSKSVILKYIRLSPSDSINIDAPLLTNKPYTSELPMRIFTKVNYTTPYWLLKPHGIGNYVIENPNLIGDPRSSKVSTTFVLEVEKQIISFDEEVSYKSFEPNRGEFYQPFSIVPKITINFKEKTHLFIGNNNKEVTLEVTSSEDRLKGILTLSLPKEWSIKPKQILINLPKKGNKAEYTFNVTPPKKSRIDRVIPIITLNDKAYSYSRYVADYSHIERQEVIMPASAKFIKFNIEKYGNKIGYIKGSGDNIPNSLRQIGYQVTLIDPNEITPTHLQNFDAIVMGIRAYNVLEDFESQQQILLNYVENGGTMVVQYNTQNSISSISTRNFSPYYLSLSRDRVVEEDAEVKFLRKRHAVLNIPNKINLTDFDNWVQERGLYFPNQWDSNFEPILSMHDKGESSKKGALLVTSYGQGYYVYTGLSFFRQLPLGVPGAYRLFANMLSLGKKK